MRVVIGVVSAALVVLAATAAVTAEEPLLSIGRVLWTGVIIALGGQYVLPAAQRTGDARPAPPAILTRRS